MRYVLSLSGDRPRRPLSGTRPAARRAARTLPAGLAHGAGADCRRLVPASLLMGGGRFDEGCRLEESEIFARDFVQAVSCGVRRQAAARHGAFSVPRRLLSAAAR